MVNPESDVKDVKDLISRIEALGRYGDVGLSIVRSEGINEWTVAIEMGREAHDSDMVGGAAYGVAESLSEALEAALSEAGV
jgi:hypothetical protein